MDRKLNDWIESYLKYTDGTESSEVFNKWVAISTVAASMRKKCWLQLGRLRVYPNLYIVLVAEPGVARKSQSINYALDLLKEVPSIKLSSDSVTAQSMMEELEESTAYDRLPDGSALRHASLSVFSKEFESFLGSGGSKMMVTLTDLFDAGERAWTHRTKSYGTSSIPSVFLNILGATTPQSLRSCLSELSFGGGLTSRILFISQEAKSKKVAIPVLTQEMQELKEILISDLALMSEASVEFKLEKDAEDYWVKWYESYDESSEKRIQKAQEFDGWYSRKPLLILKVSMCLSYSERQDGVITTTQLKSAMKMLEDMESLMGVILSQGYGLERSQKAGISRQATLILKYIQSNVSITEKHLLQLIWRDINEHDFDRYMNELLDEGKCTRFFAGDEGKEVIWYKYLKENEDES